ncbi:MAG TPA: hypothetical protein VFH68_08925 [Polyangia bacterium]|nr:hypothetical protein [Polyangia bacterium]
MGLCEARAWSRPSAAADDAATDDDQSAAPRTADAAAGVAAGAFLPWSMAARVDSQRALALVQGGYDSARRGSLWQATAEVELFGRVSLRGGSTYLGPSGTMRPDFAVRVDALRQERHGIDLAGSVGYEAQGFNLKPAIIARVAAARLLGSTRLLANAAYGVGTVEGERFGDLRLAGLRPVTRDLHVGLDSRFRIDLERDQHEPPGEPEWEVDAGPVATYALGRFVVSASAGATALKYRLVPGQHLGMISLLGAGTVF